MRNQLVFDRMQALADQAHAELVKAPQSAQQIAAKLNLVFAKADKFKPGDPLPELGIDPQLPGMIAAMKMGEVSTVAQAGNKLVIAVVTGINPPRTPEYAEVQPQVIQRYASSKSGDVVAEKSAKVMELLQKNGGDLKAAAKAVGLQVQSTDFFSRDGSSQSISGTYLGDSFDKPVGSLVGPLSVSSMTIIGKIAERQAPDMAKFAQERDTIVVQAKSQKAQQMQILFQDSVVNHLIDKGKIKKHQEVINRLMQRYRG
jgi:peptidyl-prolyl cis-trans isomerase D